LRSINWTMLGRLSFDDLRVGVKGSDDGHGRGKWPVLLQSYLHGHKIIHLDLIKLENASTGMKNQK